jgi:hypothetical protein
MPKERVRGAADKSKDAAKDADRKPADDKKVQVGGKGESEARDTLDDAEREAERAREERERSQF